MANSRVFGYLRVSTKHQVVGRQRSAIETKYPNAVFFEEVFTGTTSKRPQWSRLKNMVKAGDTIIFDSVSRMSRNKEEGVEEYFELYDRGINLIFLREPTISTDVYASSMKENISATGNDIADIYIEATNRVLKILAKKQIELAFDQAEKEVQDIQDRTKKGMAYKNAAQHISDARTGKRFPREKEAASIELIRKHAKSFGGTLNDQEMIQLCNCGRATYYRYKKIAKETESNYDE